MRRLKTLTFEKWVKHVFDHDLRDPQWYFDADGPVWAGSAEQPGSSALNSACYMFWDINPFFGAPDDPSHRELDAAALRVMAETLALDSLPCKESALHDLGHWRRHYPKPVEEIIDRAMHRQADWPEELLAYAGYAKSGYVL